ncbi:MAG: glycosyl hydrolase family 43, partial [Planctomycetota bacterium]
MPAFIDRLQPAARNGGFRMDDYWVWCGSVIRGGDGRWHMFASRWPKALTFIPHWLTNSEVVRASADNPVGPYTFEEVVLPPREGVWDGRMTHNPTIHRCGDTWLLYYTGTTYSGPVPTPEAQLEWGGPVQLEARANQRIGLAVAPSVTGPWRRFDQPVLEARPGREGSSLGLVLASGSLGAILGAVLAGFVALPFAGSTAT